MHTTKPSMKPSKRRRMLFQAPDHLRYKIFSAPLSSELKTSQGAGALPVRTGDTVRVMRGDHKGFEGKISRVDRRRYRVYMEGLTRERVDGTAVFVPVHPSKVMITHLNLDDKWRKKIVARKKKAGKARVRVEEKPKVKLEKVPEVGKVVETVEAVEGPKKKAAKKRAAARPRKKAVAKKARVKAEEKPAEAERKPKAARKPRAKRAKKSEEGEE